MVRIDSHEGAVAEDMRGNPAGFFHARRGRRKIDLRQPPIRIGVGASIEIAHVWTVGGWATQWTLAEWRGYLHDLEIRTIPIRISRASLVPDGRDRQMQPGLQREDRIAYLEAPIGPPVPWDIFGGICHLNETSVPVVDDG